MADELEQLLNLTTATPNATLQNVAHAPTATSTPPPLVSAELQSFNLPENYSVFINKLERLALGLDAAFNNLSLDHKEVEIAVTGGGVNGIGGATHAVHVIPDEYLLNAGPINSGRVPPAYVPQHPRHGAFGVTAEGMEYSRVVSDIWIGVILTLLIVSVIFFICSCFLYHKFQQWKNSYRTNPNEPPIEICRRHPIDFEAESLPSYTIVSGLPTYDDALEEFRKAGIILTPPIPMIKLFDSSGNSVGGGGGDIKENIYDGNTTNNNNNAAGDGDNISITSTCTCGGGGGGGNNGGGNNNNVANTTNNSNTSLSASALLAAAAAAANSSQQTTAPQVIELSPEQLEQLSKKRLSLQIAFNSPLPARRGSRPRIDLYREVNRNNLLRSHAYGGAGSGATTSPEIIFPPIHRSSSSLSLSSNINNERNLFDRRLSQHLQHRGSLY